MALNLATQHTRFHHTVKSLIEGFSYTEEFFIVGDELGLGADVGEFFSIIVVPDSNLPKGKDVVVMLLDEASYSDYKTFVFVILINPNAIIHKDEQLCNLRIHAALAHEVCHFVRYYEIFLTEKKYDKFKKEVSRAIDNRIKDLDSHSKTHVDIHGIQKDTCEIHNKKELLMTTRDVLVYFLSFDKDHYVRWGHSDTDYCDLFVQFIFRVVMPVSNL